MSATSRLVRFLVLLGLYVVNGMLAAPGASSLERRRRRVIAASKWADVLLRSLGIRWNVQMGWWARPPVALYVANHVSDVDPLLMNAVVPSVFVTSTEVRDSLLSGWISRAGGSYFVDRRTAAGLSDEVDGIVELLRAGLNVVIYPEGTSTNGEDVLPFRPALFAAAIKADVPVIPVAIRYRRIQGQPVSAVNRDQVFYYGRMTLGSHLLRLCGAAPVEVDLQYLYPMDSTSGDRKHLALTARQIIVYHLTPVAVKDDGRRGDAKAMPLLMR